MERLARGNVTTRDIMGPLSSVLRATISRRSYITTRADAMRESTVEELKYSTWYRDTLNKSRCHVYTLHRYRSLTHVEGIAGDALNSMNDSTYTMRCMKILGKRCS